MDTSLIVILVIVAALVADDDAPAYSILSGLAMMKYFSLGFIETGLFQIRLSFVRP